MPKIQTDRRKRKIFSARILVELADDIKYLSIIEGRDIYEVVEEALQDYLNKKRSVLDKFKELKK